jgi:hypothetical protein
MKLLKSPHDFSTQKRTAKLELLIHKSLRNYPDAQSSRYAG